MNKVLVAPSLLACEKGKEKEQMRVLKHNASIYTI